MTAVPHQNLGVRNLAGVWRTVSKALLSLAFLFAGGAFSLQLSGLDPQAPVGPDSASLRSEIAIGVALFVIALFGASSWRRWAMLMRANPIILALPAFALLSTAWAPDSGVALRRASAFMATVLSGFAVAAHLPAAQAFQFIARTAAAAIVISIVYVAVSPTYGVHQLTDGVQSVHAGDWRGVFIHRTALGRLAALCLAITVYAEAGVFGGRLGRAAVILTSVICLVMAHSGGGFASAAILLATPPILKTLKFAGRRNQLLGWGLGAGGVLLGVLAEPLLAPLVLKLLGKDATLTGRTDLWRLMLQAAGERPLFGYGYNTGFREIVAKGVAAHSSYGYVPNAQNGYLDVVLNLGLVGLAIALTVMAVAFGRAIRLAMRPEGTVLPLLTVVFIAETNAVEATLISANDILMLIYVTGLIASGEMLKTSMPLDS